MGEVDNSMMLIIVKFGLDPMSFNEMYVTVRHRGGKGQHTFLCPKGKAFKETLQEEAAKALMTQCNGEMLVLKPNEYLKFTLEVGIACFNQDEVTPKKRDCSNFIKAIEDAIYEFIGINDSYNFMVSSLKFDYKREGLVAPVIFIKVEKVSYEDIRTTSQYLRYLNR